MRFEKLVGELKRGVKPNTQSTTIRTTSERDTATTTTNRNKGRRCRVQVYMSLLRERIDVTINLWL